MKVHYPKLYNMAHLLSLNVFTASKGSNNYILLLHRHSLRNSKCCEKLSSILHIMLRIVDCMLDLTK